ncbi:MAG: DUF3325 family protein [Pseudomonas sp.]|uniref:DUF3325 family protein n=1 Tax=Pseudomonas sp. TaxID=306 RepID=UPI003398FAF8
MLMVSGLVLSVAAMLALCLGLERHARQLGRAPSRNQRRALRGLGWLLLGLSLPACGLAWGWAVGAVAWVGLLSLSGLLLALTLPYWPTASRGR